MSVTVLMAVRDAAPYLAEAVESIRAQSLTDFEFLIVDDGSSDASPAILQDFAARDKRMRLVRQEGLGLVAALNAGLRVAKYALVARMDADDVALPRRLAVQSGFLEEHPEIAAVGSAYEVIDWAGAHVRDVFPPVGAAQIRRVLTERNCLAHPSVMFRRDVVIAAGGYRAQFGGAEDYDLWLRLAQLHDLENLPEKLLRYRQHLGQVTWQAEEGRILAEICARSCPRADSALAELDGSRGRQILLGWGWREPEISQAVAVQAVNAARAASEAGFSRAALELMKLAMRQPRLRLVSRLRCLWLALVMRAGFPAG